MADVELTTADHANVFMIKSIYRQWKQAVSFSFSSGPEKSTNLKAMVVQQNYTYQTIVEYYCNPCDCLPYKFDSLNESDHNSDTDQEGDEETAVCQENEYYTGKDNSTKWSKQKPSSTVRTRAHNIIRDLPGPKAVAKEAKSKIECLNLFLYPDIITAPTVSTNTYILHIKQKYSRERDACLTDEIEMRALIGLLYLIGVMRSSRQNVLQLWNNSKGSGIEACYLSMSAHRFMFLMRCIRMDDFRDRDQRKRTDKLAAVRDVMNLFIAVLLARDRRPLKLHKLMDELEKAVVEVSEQKLPTSITIFPPDNAQGEITDEDSGEEDEVCIDNLPGSQLRVRAELNFDEPTRQENTEDSSDEEDNFPLSHFVPLKKLKTFNWVLGQDLPQQTES
ncbi:Transposase IS4 [Popillia japonica]|uniref:Transposase IS4 n=1 Tax=Popillia japonica TaxID=7064 RepID=A0AAW1JGC4_POPJA